MNSPVPSFGRVPGQGHFFRVVVLFVLVLLLQIPSLFMGFLVSERRSRRDTAATEIASKWGDKQTLTGPALVVPYHDRWTTTDAKGVRTEHEAVRHLVLLPESLRVSARVKTETRRRGIYRLPVYRLEARLAGRFEKPDFAKLDVEPASIDWTRASLALGVSDARAIERQVTLAWGGREAAFEPGIGAAEELGNGIHADLSLAGEPWGETFTVPIELRGTRGVYFTPFGRQTDVTLDGAWRDPSFQGNWLPTTRAVADSGFRAAWSVPALGRNYPQAWTAPAEMGPRITQSAFGLDLMPSIDAYRLCDRTLKYALLFFVLTFTSLWLLEVLSGRALHPIQYLLIGAALCLFELLELSLSEHLGFGVSYGLAAAAVVLLVVHYASAVLASRARAWLVGGGLALLYAFHFVVLRNEDYALLLGSLLFFGMLAAVMALTRRLDWNAPGAPPATH